MTGKERREQLIEVGRKLFAAKGFEAVSIEEIASRANVSKPVVYEHFGSKEGLYAVIVDREMNRLLDMITSALTGGHPRVLLEQAAVALFDYIDGYTDGFRILVRDAPVATSSGNFASLILDVATQVEHLLAKEFDDRGLNKKLAPMYSQHARRHGGADRSVVARRAQAQEGRGRRAPGEPGLERPGAPRAEADPDHRPPDRRLTRPARVPAPSRPQVSRHRDSRRYHGAVVDDGGPGDGGPLAPDPGQDEVDRLIDAWRRERPDLDVGPLEVLSRVSRLARHLDRARRAAFDTHGLELWEFDVLAALRRAGAPYALSPGELLRQTMVTSGTMTNRIDRLEQRGLVGRAPDQHDRRGVQVMLTAAGRALVDVALDDLLDQERRILASLDAVQREDLGRLLRAVVLPFDAAEA